MNKEGEEKTMNSIVVHKQVLKYDELEITVSAESFKIIHVDQQKNLPVIWYESNENHPRMTKVKIYYIGTGERIPDNSFHVGSTRCGPLIWHVYQEHTKR